MHFDQWPVWAKPADEQPKLPSGFEAALKLQTALVLTPAVKRPGRPKGSKNAPKK